MVSVLNAHVDADVQLESICNSRTAPSPWKNARKSYSCAPSLRKGWRREYLTLSINIKSVFPF